MRPRTSYEKNWISYSSATSLKSAVGRNCICWLLNNTSTSLQLWRSSELLMQVIWFATLNIFPILLAFVCVVSLPISYIQ
jgi:hypothetical protein